MSKAAADKAKLIAERALATAVGLGAESAIIMIGLPDGEHSAYYATFKGRCLPVRGLLEIGSETVRDSLQFPDEPSK